MVNPTDGNSSASQPEQGTLDAAIAAEQAAIDGKNPREREQEEIDFRARQRKFADGDGAQESEGQGSDEESTGDGDQPDADNPEADEDAQDAEAEEDGDKPAETVEVEWTDGQRYNIPKALEGAFMMEADYRRKTAEVARDRQSLQSERQYVRQLYDGHPTFAQEQAEMWRLQQERSELVSQTNWAELEATDVLEFSRRSGRLNLIAQRLGELQGTVQQKAAAAQQLAQQEELEQEQRARGVLQEIWPDFTPEVGEKLAKAALDIGVRPESIAQLRKGYDPVALRLLDFAFRYIELKRNAPAAQKKVEQARPMVKPGPAQGVQRGANVDQLAKKLRSTGSIGDAVALEMARMQPRRGATRR